jgi:hypothetical protein
MPDGARASEPTVAPAGVLSVLPAVEYALPAFHLLATLRTGQANRLRGPPRVPGDLQAQLMVFLT